MFYIEKDSKILLFDEDKQKLQNTITFMPQYEGLEIQEVEEGYVIYDFELMTVEEMNEQLLLKAKNKKYEENTCLAKLAVENGYVVFKDAQFETNAQTVGDLTATMLMLQAQQDPNAIYMWLSKDDQVVELTVGDFGTLGGLIAEYKNTIWQEKYITYKTQIEQAQTVEAVNKINLDYTL